MTLETIQYQPTNTALKFHNDLASFVRLILGPVGGGKTSMCCLEMFFVSARQMPDANNIRKTRWVVIRNDYPSLKCFDKETEVLTRHSGWVYFKDLNQDDLVAQLSDSGVLTYVKPAKYYSKHYKGRMVGFKNEGVDFLVTPEHKLYTSKMRTRKRVWDENYELREARHIEGGAMYRVKRDATWHGEKNKQDQFTPAFYEWLGFFFAEGSHTRAGHSPATTVFQSKGDLTKVDNLFTQAFIPFTKFPTRDGFTWRVPYQPENYWLHDMLQAMGNEGSRVIPDFVMAADAPRAAAFLDGFALGDGCRYDNKLTLYTSSEGMAGQLQQLALHAGLVINHSSRDRTMATGKGTSAGSFKPNFVEHTLAVLGKAKSNPRLYVNPRGPTHPGWYEQDYDDTIYCVEVPEHKVYVRRNGVAHWSGNSTTIKTWENWFGGMCTTVFDTPIRSRILQPLPDGTTMDMEVLFIALDDEAALKKLRSLEVTGGYISEASEIPESVVEMLAGRVGRYPKPDRTRGYAATWSGIIMESNPPGIRSWMYRRFETQRPVDHTLFRQPPPLVFNPERNEYDPNPEAENIENIAGGFEYYYRQLRSASADYTKVFILGEYGMSYSGKPVYPSFVVSTNVARAPLATVRGQPLLIGLDFGLSPAAVFTQLSPTGQLLVLDELAPQDETLEDFVNNHIKPKLAGRFRGMTVEIIGDPAGAQRNALAKMNTFQTLRQMGLASRPAVTNDPVQRISSVGYFLGRVGGLVIDPSCVTLIEGFAGGYKFQKLRENEIRVEYRDKPEKNLYSHVHDALQYAALHHQRGASTGPKQKAPARAPFRYA